MLENWCYDRESLKYLSAHFETGEPISDDMIDRIIKSKNVLAALFNLRQLFFGIYDMEIHTSEGKMIRLFFSYSEYSLSFIDEHIDTTKLYNELREKISLVKAPEVCHSAFYIVDAFLECTNNHDLQGSCGQASFGHLMGGYDAGK